MAASLQPQRVPLGTVQLPGQRAALPVYISVEWFKSLQTLASGVTPARVATPGAALPTPPAAATEDDVSPPPTPAPALVAAAAAEDDVSPPPTPAPAAAAAAVYHVGASWSGGGDPIAVPSDDVAVRVHTAGMITGVYVVTGGGAGSCVVDVWRDSFANYPPTVADTITAAAKPTIAAGIKYVDATLTGWTKTVARGDIVMFHLESVSTFETINVFLEITPS